MLKYFTVIIFIITIPVVALAQRKQIDSLQKLLPSLHNIERIDCLNELSGYYCNYDKGFRYYSRTDSAELCINKAYSEAKKINYKLGEGNAFLNLGKIYLRRWNFYTSQNYIEQAISVFKNINAQAELIRAYSILVDVFLSECDHNSALKYSEMLLNYYKKNNDTTGESDALDAMGVSYSWQGNYDKAFECMQNRFNLFKNQSNSSTMVAMFDAKEVLFRYIGWDDSVAVYAAKIDAYNKKIGNSDSLGRFFWENKFDSAEYYNKIRRNFLVSNKGYDSITGARAVLRSDIDLASIYQYEGRYKEALPMFMKALQFDKQKKVASEEAEELLNISQIFELEGKYNDAINYIHKLLSFTRQTESSYYTRNAYQELWKIYDKKKDSANAYKYFVKYKVIEDSVTEGEFPHKLAVVTELNNEKEQQLQIAALDKGNKLKEAVIQKNVLIRNILLAGVFIFILLAIIIYRIVSLKRKNDRLENATLQHSLELERIQNEKKQSELQSKATELEMRALRAQMNPHFIFNCLSSINRFILKNKTEEASDYLTKFSRLIRMVLNNSKRAFISLEDELETLRLYLDMERLRFKNSFDYGFTYNNALDVGNIFIPPLLLQPFAENAIWHGLMHKQEKGFLNFNFSVEEKFLSCMITDNGVGREQADLLKSKSAEKQKSMGLKITTERLSLLNSNSNEQTFFTIEDLTNDKGNATGTRVHLKIFYKEMTEV